MWLFSIIPYKRPLVFDKTLYCDPGVRGWGLCHPLAETQVPPPTGPSSLNYIDHLYETLKKSYQNRTT